MNARNQDSNILSCGQFCRRFFSISLFLVMQNVLTLSVNLADNVMLGAYSETALSGATAANQLQFIFQEMLNALCDGAVVLGAQYWGRRDTETVGKVAVLALRAAAVLAMGAFAVVSLFPAAALRLFTSDQAILQNGLSYLAIVRFGYLFSAVTAVFLAALRSVEVVRIAFWLSLLTLALNCGMNYLLIYGRCGAPELGVQGAAIATVTARAAGLLIVLLYLKRHAKALWPDRRGLLRRDAGLSRNYWKLTLPLLLAQSVWGISTAAQTAILGHMEDRAIAANSAASNLFLLVKSASVGSAAAASVLIGKAIGAGDTAAARCYAKRLQFLFVITGLVSAGVLYILRTPVLSLYDMSPEAGELANEFLLILCVVYIGMSYQMPTTNGILKGGGSTKFCAKLNLISTWGIVLPLSAAVAFWFHGSPAAVVWCLNADQLFKCVPAFLKVNYGNWMCKLAGTGQRHQNPRGKIVQNTEKFKNA